MDLTQATNVYVTISQCKNVITKTGDDINVSAHSVECWLTQEESLSLRDGQNADIQMNWTYPGEDGESVRRAATKVKTIRVTKQLLQEEVS